MQENNSYTNLMTLAPLNVKWSINNIVYSVQQIFSEFKATFRVQAYEKSKIVNAEDHEWLPLFYGHLQWTEKRNIYTR